MPRKEPPKGSDSNLAVDDKRSDGGSGKI